MIKLVNCPHCDHQMWPAPFVGRVFMVCEECLRGMILSTNGVSFSTSDIRVTKPVNGEAAHMPHTQPSAPLRPASAPSVV